MHSAHADNLEIQVRPSRARLVRTMERRFDGYATRAGPRIETHHRFRLPPCVFFTTKTTMTPPRKTGRPRMTCRRAHRSAPNPKIDCIDLTSDDDGTPLKKPAAKPTGRSKAKDAGSKNDSDDEVQVVERVQPPVILLAATDHGAGGSGLHDEDVAVVGTRNEQVFMHVRHHCTTFPVKSNDPMIHCEKCCCYVCDTFASVCPEWSAHCRADPKSTEWQKMRCSAKYERDHPPRPASRPPPRPAQATGPSSRSTTPINDSTTCRRPRTPGPSTAVRRNPPRSGKGDAPQGSLPANRSRAPRQKTPGSSESDNSILKPVFGRTRANRISAQTPASTK